MRFAGSAVSPSRTSGAQTACCSCTTVLTRDPSSTSGTGWRPLRSVGRGHSASGSAAGGSANGSANGSAG